MDFINHKAYLNNIDDDCCVHGETTIGVNFKNQLVVCYHYFNDENHQNAEKNIAIIDEEDTKTLAKMLKVKTEEVPAALNDKFGSRAYYCNPDEAEAIFGNVIDFIIEAGLRFKMEYQ